MKQMTVTPRTTVITERVEIPKMKSYKNLALTVNSQFIQPITLEMNIF